MIIYRCTVSPSVIEEYETPRTFSPLAIDRYGNFVTRMTTAVKKFDQVPKWSCSHVAKPLNNLYYSTEIMS